MILILDNSIPVPAIGVPLFIRLPQQIIQYFTSFYGFGVNFNCYQNHMQVSISKHKIMTGLAHLSPPCHHDTLQSHAHYICASIYFSHWPYLASLSHILTQIHCFLIHHSIFIFSQSGFSDHIYYILCQMLDTHPYYMYV